MRTLQQVSHLSASELDREYDENHNDQLQIPSGSIHYPAILNWIHSEAIAEFI